MAFRNFDASFHQAVSRRRRHPESARIYEINLPLPTLVNERFSQP